MGINYYANTRFSLQKAAAGSQCGVKQGARGGGGGGAGTPAPQQYSRLGMNPIAENGIKSLGRREAREEKCTWNFPQREKEAGADC